ncbi:fungal pheromone STE3G-protein-coupled receptor [Schizopora paradoxa]|uniref:Fungal pheromone STE3G-protein-coupled receptor n=1 Tax=Schizopora paradoxa TaxID=27342 RepID=A0A0H2R2N1_9AGAM|nr:fungal pheromone STE3G-protein-coupled receptor [Schizopora paradoxa]
MYALTPYPITPIACFLGVVLALLPLLSHIRKFSLGVWGFALWTAIANFIMFVNTIIWHDNVGNTAPVWCDITTKLQMGAGVGMTASSFVISLRLYKVTNRRTSVETRVQRRKAISHDILLMIGLPFVLMGLTEFVQPVRFEIMEEIGCSQIFYSYLGYAIGYAPVVILNLLCLTLAPLTSRAFFRHRKEMNEFLSSGEGSITRSKYIRFMVMAYMDSVLNLPATIGLVVMNIALGKESPLNYPYISWKNVHEGAGGNMPGLSLSSVIQMPASEWSNNAMDLASVKWNEWFHVVIAIVFFAIFGTTPEMRRYYRSAFWFIPERLGYKKRRTSESETISDMAFDSHPNPNPPEDPNSQSNE